MTRVLCGILLVAVGFTMPTQVTSTSSLILAIVIGIFLWGVVAVDVIGGANLIVPSCKILFFPMYLAYLWYTRREERKRRKREYYKNRPPRWWWFW